METTRVFTIDHGSKVRVSVDILQHLSSDDSLEHGMDGGSDDDLGWIQTMNMSQIAL